MTRYGSNSALEDTNGDYLAVDQTISGDLHVEQLHDSIHIRSDRVHPAGGPDAGEAQSSVAANSLPISQQAIDEQLAIRARAKQIQSARSRGLFTRIAVALLVGSSAPLLVIAYLSWSANGPVAQPDLQGEQRVEIALVASNNENIAPQAVNQNNQSVDDLLIEAKNLNLTPVTELSLIAPEDPELLIASQIATEAQIFEQLGSADRLGATQVSIGDPNATLALVAEQPLPKAPVKSQTTIVEYAETRPVAIGPRRYLMTSSTPRSYSPGFAAAKNQKPANSTDGKIQSATRARVDIHSLKGTGSNRYQADNNAVEWQGGWSYADPGHNLKIGSAYSQYLSEELGSEGGAELSAVLPQRSSLLSRSIKTGVGPSAAGHK